MEIEWLSHRGHRRFGRVPKHVRPYVDAIGPDLAAKLCLELGGAEINLPSQFTRPDSLIAKSIGVEAALKLGKALGHGNIAIPTASRFLTYYLASQGVGAAEIARRVRRTGPQVRRYLRGDGANR